MTTKCYECKFLTMTEESFPFCSKVCHELWIQKNWKPKTAIKNKEYMQKRLLEMGKEL